MVQHSSGIFLARAVIVTEQSVSKDFAPSLASLIEADEIIILSTCRQDEWMHEHIKFSGHEPRLEHWESLVSHVVRALKIRLGFTTQQVGSAPLTQRAFQAAMGKRLRSLRPDSLYTDNIFARAIGQKIGISVFPLPNAMTSHQLI